MIDSSFSPCSNSHSSPSRRNSSNRLIKRYGKVFSTFSILLLITVIFFVISLLSFISVTSQINRSRDSNLTEKQNSHSKIEPSISSSLRSIQEKNERRNNEIQGENDNKNNIDNNNNFDSFVEINNHNFLNDNFKNRKTPDPSKQESHYRHPPTNSERYRIEPEHGIESVNKESWESSDATVTLITQTSLESHRIRRVLDLMFRWPGHMVIVAVLPSQNIQHAYQSLSTIKRYVAEHQRRDSVKIIPATTNLMNKASYPINKLRNLAISQVETNYYFLLDVDFLPSDTLYENLHSKYLKELIKTKNKTVLVVPAFDLKRRYLAKSIHTKIDAKKHFPKNLKQFHYKFPVAHEPTNYSRWINTNEPYDIEYGDHFEPYFICHINECPLYREEFVGFGYNKLSQVYEAWTRGFRFRVLPDDFIMHIPHAYSKDVRNNSLLKTNMNRFIAMQKELMKETGRAWLLFDQHPIQGETNTSVVDWSEDAIQKRYRGFVSRREKKAKQQMLHKRM